MKATFFLVCMLYFGLVEGDAQYYYDRSKNPDKKIVVADKAARDFDHYIFLSFDENMPTSNTAFINSSSSIATKLGFRKRLNDVDKFWVGADLGWSVYKEHKPLDTYNYGAASISTDLFNYAYSYSLTGNFDYFFLPTVKIVSPYAGMGLGISYAKFSQYYNIYSASTDSWGLQLRPEVGVLVGLKENASWRMKIAFHYDYATNASNLVTSNFITKGNDNYKNFVSYGFQIGIVKMAW